MNANPPSSRHWWRIMVVVLLVLGLYGVVPHLIHNQSLWETVRNADTTQLVLALVAISATYVAASAVYMSLALHSLSFRRTLLVQFAAMFINRLLPAGSGALGINAAYLYKMKHTAAEAVSVVSLNNIVGVAGHLCLLLVLVGPSSLSTLAHKSSWLSLVGILLLVGLVLVLRFIKRGRLWQQFKAIFGQYRQHPRRLFGGLVSSWGITLANTACLWLCLSANGVSISFSAALVVLSLGVGAASAVPLPGGLGSTEAGLYSGLVLQGVENATALSSVLLYRLVSYWLPLLVGAVAFIYCQNHGYFRFRKNSA